jgi:hypothetical protein
LAIEQRAIQEKKMSRPYYVCIAMLSLLPSLTQAAPSRAKLEVMLSGFETIPSRESLLRFDPRVEQLLAEIVLQPTARPLARNRAITVLQYFPSKSTSAVLQKVIKNAAAATHGRALLELRLALLSYAVVAGSRAVAVVTPFLTHANVDLRISAAKALTLSHAPEARQLLMGRLKAESSPLVRLELQHQVQALQGAKADLKK